MTKPDIWNRIFSLQAYKDETERYHAANFYILMGLAFLITPILGVFSIIEFFIDDTQEYSVPILGLGLLALIGIWLARQGYLNLAVRTFIGLFFLITVIDHLSLKDGAGLLDVSPIWVMAIYAALTLEYRNFLYALGLLGLEITMVGLVNPGFVHPDYDGWWTELFIQAIIFFTIAWLISRTTFIINQAVTLPETRRRLSLTETSAVIARNLFARHDLQALLEEAVTLIRNRFDDIYHAQVFLIDEESNYAILKVSTGEIGKQLIARGHKLEVGSRSVIGQVTLTGEYVRAMASTAGTESIHKANELLKETATELALPLRSAEGIIGALDVQSQLSDAFSEEDIAVLQVLADQLAVAIESARLLERVQAEADRSRIMAEATRLTGRISPQARNAVQELLKFLAESRQYSRWWFGLLEPDGRYLRRTEGFADNLTDRLPAQIDLQQDNNALAKAVNTNNAIIVNQFDNHPIFGEIPASDRQLYGRHFALPVMGVGGEKVIGGLLVGRAPDAQPLDDQEVQFVNTLARQLGIAIENLHLFEQTQNEQRTMQSVIGTMRAGVLVIDNQSKIQFSNDEARRLLGENAEPGRPIDAIENIYRTGTSDRYQRKDLPVTLARERRQPASAEDLTIHHDEYNSFDLLARAAPILDENNNVTHVVAVFQDITELRDLENALQESLSETTRLYEVSRAISHAMDIEHLKNTIISQMRTLRPNEIYLILYESTPDVGGEKEETIKTWPEQLNVRFHDLALPRSIVEMDETQSTARLTFATSQIESIPNITEDELEQLRREGIKGLAALPLSTRGQMIGLVVATFKTLHQFTTEERRFLLTLADQAAVAFKSLRLVTSTQKALTSMSRLYNASRTMSEAQAPDEALNRLVDQVKLLRPDRIDIVMTGSNEQLDLLEHSLGWGGDEMTELAPLIEVDQVSAFDLLTQDEVFIDSPASANGHTDAQVPDPYRTMASLPFRAGGQPTGRLLVGFRSFRQLSDEDKQFLWMLSDSMGYVIENDRLFRQTQDSLEETGILYQAIRSIANASNEIEILQAIIDYAADPLVDKALLCMLLSEYWDSDNALIEVTASWERADSVNLTGMRFTAEQFPSWEQLSSPEVLWVDDVMLDPTLDDTARMGYRALEISAFVIIPLVASGKPIGAILLGSDEPRHHRDREIRVYQSLADQAAITLENKRLYTQVEHRARQLATSAEVTRAATAILDLDELLPRMVNYIQDVFKYDHVQVFLLSPDGKDALLKASTGEAGRQLLSIGHKLAVGSRSVIGEVTSKGEPSIALDTADARVIHKPNPYLPNTRSEMALPLIVKGEVVGALDVQSNQPGAFTEEDTEVLTVLSNQLAVAIDNAQLFQTSQKRRAEMGFLFEVTSESMSAPDMDSLLKTVSELLLMQTQATVVMAFLLNEEEGTLEPVALSSNLDEVARRELPPISIEDGIAGWVTRNRKEVLIRNMEMEEHYAPHFENMKSGIYAPLRAGERVFGVVAVESNTIAYFDDSSLNLLQALTGSLAAVIQNIRLVVELQETNRRLREIDELKTNFLAAMSHELRTPLNSIIGFSRVILKGIDGPITRMQDQDLTTIHDSGKHLLNLVNDILDQAKIEAGKMELAKEYFDLGIVVKSTMASAEGLTKEKDIHLFTELADDLPQAFGDEFRTRQILFNLVSNAAKFTEHGSITMSAHSVKENDINFIQVSVTDTGIGIDEKDFGKLFESFQQVDNSTTRKAEGTGLGLPLARSLAELQGGKIWVESAVGVGSTFSVLIPTEPLPVEETEVVEDDSETTDGTPVEAATTPALPELTHPPGVIIAIDDEVGMINLYRRYLAKEGYNVIGVTKGEQAEEMVIRHRPAAILLDVNLPDRNGWDILASLKKREDTRNFPIIICSIEDDKEKSHSLGAMHHLIKPFAPEDLIAVIRELKTSGE